MLQMPHKQTDADREYMMREIVPLWHDFPKNFTFPLAVDPNYRPKTDMWYVLITAMICFSITSTAVCLRLWLRSKGKFGMDDWLIIPAFISYICFSMINLVGVLYTGLGFKITDCSMIDIRNGILIQYLHTIFWTPVINLARLSILYLLLRLTPPDFRKIVIFIKTAIYTSWIFALVTMLLLIFECRPLSVSFDLKSRLEGKCLGAPSLAMYGTLCLVHAFLDLMTIVPPVPIIARMKMSKAKKYNLYALLACGALAIFCTTIRTFVYYHRLITRYDQMRGSMPIGFWGILESSLAVTVACLPAINHYVRAQFIKAKDSMSSMMSRTSASSHQKAGVNYRHQAGGLRIFRGPLSLRSSYMASAVGPTTVTLDTYKELEEGKTTQDAKDGNIKISRSVDVSSEEVQAEECPSSPPLPPMPSLIQIRINDRDIDHKENDDNV